MSKTLLFYLWQVSLSGGHIVRVSCCMKLYLWRRSVSIPPQLAHVFTSWGGGGKKYHHQAAHHVSNVSTTNSGSVDWKGGGGTCSSIFLPPTTSTMKILAGGKILDNRKKSVWEILIKFSQMNVAARARAGLSAGKFLHPHPNPDWGWAPAATLHGEQQPSVNKL